jgi:ribosome-binding protein aMBF1 (putative translation factor)
MNSSALEHQTGNPRSGRSSWIDEKIDGSVKKSGIDSSGVHSCKRCIEDGYSAGTHLKKTFNVKVTELKKKLEPFSNIEYLK